MANCYQPTQDQINDYDAWVCSRPDRVRKVAEQFRPWKWYRLSTTGQSVSVIGFSEPEDPNQSVTVRIVVDPKYNLGYPHAVEVFGILPEELSECEAPEEIGHRAGWECLIETVRQNPHLAGQVQDQGDVPADEATAEHLEDLIKKIFYNGE